MAGVMPEYKSKQVLQALGIPIPQGALARNIEEAQAIARKIGYPVALKAQSAELSHKSDAGGVVLNLANPEDMAAGWQRMHADIDRARPGLRLDGVLVEADGCTRSGADCGREERPRLGRGPSDRFRWRSGRSAEGCAAHSARSLRRSHRG